MIGESFVNDIYLLCEEISLYQKQAIFECYFPVILKNDVMLFEKLSFEELCPDTEIRCNGAGRIVITGAAD